MKSKHHSKHFLIFSLFAVLSLASSLAFASNPVALAATQNAKWIAKNKISTGSNMVYNEVSANSKDFSLQADDRTVAGCSDTITVDVSKKNPTTGTRKFFPHPVYVQHQLSGCGKQQTNTIKLTNNRPGTTSKECAPDDTSCIDNQDKGTGSGSSGNDKPFVPCSNLKGQQKTICENEAAALNNSNSPAETAKSCGSDANCQEIFTYLIGAVQVLSAIVGVVVVAMIIYGGIEYSTSAGNPEKAASAKAHITNALFALLAFFFLWAFLNFLIPGGVFHG